MLGDAPQIATTKALKSQKGFDVLVVNTEWRLLGSSLAAASSGLSHPAKLHAELEGQMAFTIKDKLLNSKGLLPVLLRDSSTRKMFSKFME